MVILRRLVERQTILCHIEATDFDITPRNLGLSPIENVFSDVKCQMQDYALVTMAMLYQLFNRDHRSQYFINE